MEKGIFTGYTRPRTMALLFRFGLVVLAMMAVLTMSYSGWANDVTTQDTECRIMVNSPIQMPAQALVQHVEVLPCMQSAYAENNMSNDHYSSGSCFINIYRFANAYSIRGPSLSYYQNVFIE